ncbi:MAG: Asp-tRNA(Asn)/Glu-tRNA(Gln) amidotransferase subunit GatB [Actinobacteria bacterium]|nr:MAG: Asp-tRNA(Asn)/Glu-tRNA(Gln) amidotransferase subunit GatB [Actinomycetota bacterium]
MSEWEPVIGLEVHAHLKTRTKMFCRCALDYGAPENSRTCPVCLAHPGALPVPNERAIELTIKLGLALDCEIAERAVFARKNYFYPDLPKGYQISQYESPLCGRGRLVVPVDGGEEVVGIVRAHLEEDAAKTVHAGGATGRSVGATASLVDFNRGGTPLVEIVSEPDMHSADQALRYLRLLRQTIVELGVSDAEMEKGTLRADVNVSVRKRGEEGFRPRWEIKNMNSFTFIGRAIEAAVRQQVAAHEAGAEVVQSTYDYDADTDRLTVHRSKEEADDYRYFPEPDLVPVAPPPALVEHLRGELHELPAARTRRLEPLVGFALAHELVSTGNEHKAELLAAEGVEWRTAANVAMNRGEFLAENAGALAAILRANVTREALDDAFTKAATEAIAAGDYLAQAAVGDESELAPIVDAVLAANPGQVETYRGGKEGVLGFFVGQVMRETGGKADPKVVNRLVRERLAAR